MKSLKRLEGQRKWTVAVLVLVTSFVLALLGELSGEWVKIAIAVVGVFTSGNMIEHLKEIWTSRSGY
jgi:hypothetical protein